MVAKCKLCSKTKTGAYVKGISCCTFCSFVIKHNKSSIYTFIGKLNEMVSRSNRYNYGEMFIKLYPELLKDGIVKKEDVGRIRQDIIFNYKKICLKNKT